MTFSMMATENLIIKAEVCIIRRSQSLKRSGENTKQDQYNFMFKHATKNTELNSNVLLRIHLREFT